jgi:methionyl-tRNA formyltransferase
MTKPKLLFVGNRRFVLEEIFTAELDIVKICVIAGSHLEKDVRKMPVAYEVVSAKEQLIKLINDTDFDLLLSNGCPFILPIGDLPAGKKYVNIHPSYLPDLRGRDPVIGSILFGRDSGATCHLMDAGIDTGKIISQVKIDWSEDLDVCLLYQLSFLAEKEVFHLALKRNFEPLGPQVDSKDAIYYSRSESDRDIDFKDSADTIVRRVKAFSNQSQGAIFKVNDNPFLAFDAQRLTNRYLIEKFKEQGDGCVLLIYEDCLLFKTNGEVVKLGKIKGELSKITRGTKLD